jgi:hypothetical protein
VGAGFGAAAGVSVSTGPGFEVVVGVGAGAGVGDAEGEGEAVETTVNTDRPVTLPSVALMKDVPGAAAVARPVAEMVATAALDDAQVTWLVRSSTVLLERMPVAVNGSVVPVARLGFTGVTTID